MNSSGVMTSTAIRGSSRIGEARRDPRRSAALEKETRGEETEQGGERTATGPAASTEATSENAVDTTDTSTVFHSHSG